MKLSFLLLILSCLTVPIWADFKQLPIDQAGIQKDPNQPSSINVSFNMGNSQEAPTSNTSTITPTQQIRLEHTHKSEPLPKESMISRVTNCLIGGAATAVGSAMAYQVIDILKKIFLKG